MKFWTVSPKAFLRLILTESSHPSTKPRVKLLLSIKTIELLNLDEVIVQGNSCAQFESGDGLVHKFLAPIGGKILKRNSELLENPALIEKDPYFEGWLYKVIPSDIGYETKSLIPCSSERL